jgi:alkylation response protein AidB-like acyl-CoA dehydrogenase
VFVVTAITDPARQQASVSSFIVERGMPGCHVGPRIETTGVRTAAISELVLDGCELGPDHLLGGEGGGLARTGRIVARWQRGCGLAPWLGLVRAALAHSLAHARGFHRLGGPLAGSQSVRARLADMRIRVALCERMQARAAWQIDHAGAGADRDLAVTRLFLGESVAAIARDAADICAPEALAFDHPIGRLARDVAFAGRLGVDPIVLRSIIAGSLLGLG